MTRAIVALGVCDGGPAYRSLATSQRFAARFHASARIGAGQSRLPGRPWYRHLIYAPRFTYASEILPGVSEAIEAGDGGRSRAQARRLADALRSAAAALDHLN